MNDRFGSPFASGQIAMGQPFSPAMDYYIPQWEERTSYGMRRIDPYTKLFEDRIIFLGTPISDDIANAVMAQLLCLQQMDAERDIEIQAREILRIRSLMEQMLADDTGKTPEEVSRDIERDKYLTADQARDYGIIDEVLTSLKAVPV